MVLLRGLTWLTCLVYLDDIVIFTKGGVERHVIELAGVFERLRAAGLSLKLKKCTFMTTSMEYLGHHLSNHGVQPAERLVESVRELPRTVDTAEVKRFVHLAGHYRKFMAAFGSIVGPMTRLLKKDVEWEWCEAQEFAFKRVKLLLTTRPLLLYLNFELPFRLVTGASKVGLGRSWAWVATDGLCKLNNKAESNYSITELECLAVVWAVKKFRPYLYGRAFTIITDHAALKWLMTRTTLPGRLHRWALVLQEYEFQVEYRPGSTNVEADALSRAPAAVRVAVGRQRRRPAATARSATTETGVTALESGGMATYVTPHDDRRHTTIMEAGQMLAAPVTAAT
ncbi:Retrovirus Polyprotein [Phytophthora megakarya]|uniref:Retrovirus Polyprotein n=1 Tax=Phytophthora megakarya TaxID=4795 RepID=A0A225VWB9_9STRA|nr:Retrovirus Polyprotein [Phytophthora megakarya]